MIIALTTSDNPYDPVENFDDWFNFDTQKGYNSCQYLARIAKTSDQLSDFENEQEIERAIDEIIQYGVAIDRIGNTAEYKKVKRKENSMKN